MVIGVLMTLVACAASVAAAELPAAFVQPYLKVQVLLSTDEFKGVTDAAKEIQTAAATMGKDAEPMIAGAKKMAEAKNIDRARNAFGDLSEALVAYAKKTKTTLPADLYIAYCPMEDKHWVQKGQDIKNPYFGAQMLECGEIKK
jgi:hypothetical protein